MYILSFAIDFVVYQDIPGRCDGKLSSSAFQAVREHCVISLIWIKWWNQKAKSFKSQGAHTGWEHIMVYSAQGDQEYCYFYLLGGETTAKSSKASFQSKFFWYSSKLPSGLLVTSHRKQSSSRGNHLSARRARAFISLASIPLAFTYFFFPFFLVLSIPYENKANVSDQDNSSLTSI